MARRGFEAPRSNCLRVTTPTCAASARSSWVQSSKALAARHWAGVTLIIYASIEFRQICLFTIFSDGVGNYWSFPRADIVERNNAAEQSVYRGILYLIVSDAPVRLAVSM
jgi:hypothetical protein